MWREEERKPAEHMSASETLTLLFSFFTVSVYCIKYMQPTGYDSMVLGSIPLFLWFIPLKFRLSCWKARTALPRVLP